MGLWWAQFGVCYLDCSIGDNRIALSDSGYCMSSRYFIAALTLSLGCAPSLDTIYVDDRFTSEEIQDIQEAADLWRHSTSGLLQVRLLYGYKVSVMNNTGGGARLVRATEKEILSAYPDKGKLGVRWLEHDPLNLFRTGEVIAVMPQRFEGYWMRTVVAHELGHHFDLAHVRSDYALMYPKPSQFVVNQMFENGCLMRADRNEVCNTWGDCRGVKVCQ